MPGDSIFVFQFFITSVNARPGESEIKNEIGRAIFNRIVKAHQ
jgi:hypothetical protein